MALSVVEPERAVAERPAPRTPVGPTAAVSFVGAADRIIAMQRAAGNAAVARLLRAEQPLARQENVGAVPAVKARPRRTLARYAHSDCTEDDLKNHVWPADYLARQMVKKAIKALSASPIEPSVAALFPKYFMTGSPSVAKILRVFDKVDAEFRDNDYTYECEEDCKSDDNGYTWSGFVGALTSSHIHLCMNNFRSRSNECLARTIVHEFTHRYAGTDDNGYCKTGCGYSSCPAGLTADDALENADSHACFAYELWPMRLLTAAAEPASERGAETEPVTAVA